MRWNLVAKSYVILALATLGTGIAWVSAQGPMPSASAEHKGLEIEVGTWDAESKFWFAPGTQPVAAKAVEVNKMLGEMWIVSDYTSEMMGKPFIGHGQFGYDPMKKKYVGTWIDSTAPYLSIMEGTMDEATHTLTMMSEGVNPMTGKKETNKMVSKIIDKDHKQFEIFGQVPGQEGKWWKKMEVNYTRRK